MTPVTYRIPITRYVINNEEIPKGNVLLILEGIRRHLYLAANMTYQHYYQLLEKGDPMQKQLFYQFKKYQDDDKKAWAELNDAKLKYHHKTQEAREKQKGIIEERTAEVRNIRNEAKRNIYEFVAKDEFIATLIHKFRDIIPSDVMHHSMAKVLQELYTDMPYIDDEKIRQPLRVYSSNFPICFGWNDGLPNSFKWLEKKPGEKAVQFYLFRWLNNDELGFRCRVGKRLTELAELLTQLSGLEKNPMKNTTENKISYHNVGDPSIQYIGKKKWVLQFTYKPDPVPVFAEGSNTMAMGIDLGYKVPISWAIADDNNTTGEIGNVDEIKEKRRDIQALYKKKIAAIRHTRSGKGRSRKAGVLRSWNFQERNFFRNLNAQWAHELLDIAEKNKVALIKIEDLDFEKKKQQLKAQAKSINLTLAQRSVQKKYKSWPDNLLTMYRNWSYGDLINRIEKEAEQRGIMVARVNPYFTSRCCWKCGREGDRETQAELRFTMDQVSQCRDSDTGECVLCTYDEKSITRQERRALNQEKKGKTPKPIYTHFLMADKNAAIRIARAQQYHVSNNNTVMQIKTSHENGSLSDTSRAC